MTVKTKQKVAAASSLVILLIFAVFTLAPFVFLLISSFKPGVELIRNGISLNPQFELMSFDNYKLLLTAREGIYPHWYKNSLIITFIYTLTSLFFTSLVGYGLAMYKFRGRELIFSIVLIVMMIPIEILILPLYKLSTNMRIIDTYWGVVLPFMVSPISIFFFRQYATGLPKEYMDAARIDGCTEFGIYFRIMMPLMLPDFGAMAILNAMSSWNGFVWPLIVLRSNHKLTLPIGLASLLTPYGNSYDLLLSGSVMSVIPIVIIFLLNQKAFISGLTVGGVKG